MVKNQALKKAYMIALALTVIIILLTAIFRSTPGMILHIPEAEQSDNWSIAVGTQSEAIPAFPARVSVPVNEDYTIYKTISASDEFLYLLISADHQDVIVKLEDDVLFTSPSIFESYTIHAKLHFVLTIVNDTGTDQELSITFRSPYARTSGLIMPIFESTDSTAVLYTHIMFQHIWFLGFGILFVLMGIVALAISHVVDPARSKGRFYLAMFAVVFGLWIISKSTMLQFFTGNAYILGGLTPTLFMLIPIPLLLYYKGYITTKFERECLWMIGYYAIQAFVIIILQLIGVIDFYQLSLFIQIMMLTGMAFLLLFIVIEVLNGNDVAKKFSRYYGILFLYGFITFINEQTFNQTDLSIYSLAVLTLLALVILIDYIFFIERRLKLSYRSEDYAKLAYMDRLTGSKNRHAYEEDFERYFTDENFKRNLRLVFFDFDGLKNINDQYGHTEGDFVLKEGFNAILNAFGRYGECYRIGGDEFSCIIQSLDDGLYHGCREQLIKDIKTFSSYHKYDLNISVGTSIYKKGIDSNPNDMIARADKNMYQDKKGRK